MVCFGTMKYLIWMSFFAISIAAGAEDKSQESAFQIQARYAYSHHSKNCYNDSSGAEFCGSGNMDLRFLGLGFRYLYKPIEFSGFGIEPYGELLFGIRRHNDNPLGGGQLGVEGSYTLLAHSPFIGLFYSRLTEPNSPLQYKPALGARIGYRYFFGQHVVGGAYEWLRFRSENAPTVNDQLTTLATLSLIYAYTF